VGQYLAPDDDAPAVGGGGGAGVADGTKITIGEALEAAGFAAGRRPVELSDAAAIQVAEVRATGLDANIPGGLAAEAQSAADSNALAAGDEDKTTLGDVLSVRTYACCTSTPLYLFVRYMTDRFGVRAGCDEAAGCGQGGRGGRRSEGGARRDAEQGGRDGEAWRGGRVHGYSRADQQVACRASLPAGVVCDGRDRVFIVSFSSVSRVSRF
jgi:hypothetical protein